MLYANDNSTSGSNSQALVGVTIKVTYGALAAVEAATLQV